MAEEKLTSASKALLELRQKQDRLKAELASLAKEQQQAQQLRQKELATEAAALCDKTFKSIFTGQVSKDMEALRTISQELMQMDGRSYQTLTADESASIRFFGKFCLEALANGRGLADILPKAWAHSDNPYRQA